MNLKRLLLFLLIGFAVFFIIESPTEAGKLVRETGENAKEWVATAADSFSTFLKSLL